jgi:hypothetical protein
MVSEWTVVITRHGCTSSHYTSETEAYRLAQMEDVIVKDGPRPLTEWERLTPQERDARRPPKEQAA